MPPRPPFAVGTILTTLLLVLAPPGGAFRLPSSSGPGRVRQAAVAASLRSPIFGAWLNPRVVRSTAGRPGGSRSVDKISAWRDPRGIRPGPACARATSMAATAGEAYGLGFDFGTSGARVCVVDGATQAPLHDASVPYAEQSPEVWVTAMETLLDGIPGAMRARITSIAVSGTSATVMLVDGRTGKVSRAPRMYDFAAAKDAVALASSAAPEGHTVRSATSTLAKVLQWHQESPILPEERIAHQADFLAAHLAGTGLGRAVAGYTSDYNNALKLGYDVHALEYPTWMLELLSSLGLDAQLLLPAVVRPGGQIGPVTEAARKVCMDIHTHTLVWIYIHTLTYTHVWIYIHIHTYIHTHTHTNVLYIYTYVCMHACMHTYIRICIHTYIDSVCMYVCMFVCIHTQTHTHTNTHACICICLCIHT